MTTAGMTAANPIAHETLRKADLPTIAELLESQRLRTVDLSIQGRNLWVANANLIVQGVEPHVDADGVTDVNGTFAFGEVGLESLATRIGVPQAFLRTLRGEGKTDLFDTVAGYQLRGEMNGEPSPYTAPDERVHTVRLLRADESQNNEVDGMVRAFLGGRYLALDSIDILLSVVQGMNAAGLTPDRYQFEADLTESRMFVKVWVPELYALAPAVFGNYVSPFTGETVNDMPKVFAGLVFGNSEVGRGRWSVTPRIVFQACKNGQNISKDAFGVSHVGSKHDGDGVIKWSRATQQARLDVVKNETADAVRTFLDVNYVKAQLEALAEQAATPAKGEPEEVITKVTRHTGNGGAKAAILAMYLQGQQHTAGGVMQAYTAAAQHMQSGDVAYDLENKATDAMQWVAAHSR